MAMTDPALFKLGAIVGRSGTAWSQFPTRSRVWAFIVVAAFAAVTATFYAAPEIALQYWYLLNTPLTIAAFVFGLRGALAGAIGTVIVLIFLYFNSMIVHAQLSAALQPIVALAAVTSGTRDAQALMAQMSDLAGTDPSTAGARAGGGLLVLIITNLFFGLMADRGRRSEHMALDRAAGQLKRYFSPQLVDAIVSGERAVGLATVRKEITVLFADLRGFTELTERLEPEELGAMLNTYLTEMTDVIFKHDGTLDKYIGDAVMAFFGDPVSHGDDPERAIRAAVEMRERFETLRSTWMEEGRSSVHVGIGVNTGYATVGNVGSPVRMEYTVVGSTVNVGARLADRAAPGQILTSQRTLAAVRHLVEWRTTGAATLQGVAQPVEAIEIKGLRLVAESESAHASSAYDVVLSRATDDATFRAVLMIQPEEALKAYRLNDAERSLVQQVITLLGYPVFRDISGKGIVRFTRLARQERLAAGTTLHRQGDAATRFYLVGRGELALYQRDAQGSEHHVATLGRGAYVGDTALLAGTPLDATVRTMTDVEMWTLDAESLAEMQEFLPFLGQGIASRRRESRLLMQPGLAAAA